MTPAPPPAAQQRRRAYDHRLREHVHRTGVRGLGHGLHVPRSTISSWKRRGPRAMVSLEPFGHDSEQLLTTIDKMEKRLRILAAAVRLLLALLRASEFRLAGQRSPRGSDQGQHLLWRWRSRRRRGRPPIDIDLHKLIRRMWRENGTWGENMICGELAKLGYRVAGF